MRRGRRTETIRRHPSVNCSVTARNLPAKDLGGVILGCTRHTMKECLTNQIFGLPAFHYTYVRKIKPGLPVFLFNYSDRKIHGIFEAASNGQMNINPHGWSEDGQEPTKYPAQVRICIRKQCKSLLEEQYKPILIGNYFTEDYFWFELDDAQTRQLILLFESLHVAKANRASRYDKKVGESFRGKVTQFSMRNEAKKAQSSSKWNALQDMNSDSDENEEEGSSSATPFKEENEEEVIYRKLLQIVNEREKEATPFKEANDEELVYHKLLQLVNEREKANCSHSICRRNVSRWFSAVPLSGYVALVFILWVALRFYSEE
ncbi:hypothetical protein MKX01_004606 [Papaver californicum]|nr:hypothetical protein MKX01_004606 [Papaver californicum]